METALSSLPGTVLDIRKYLTYKEWKPPRLLQSCPRNPHVSTLPIRNGNTAHQNFQAARIHM